MTLDEARIVLEAFGNTTSLRPYQMRAKAEAYRMVDDAAMLIAGREEVERMKKFGATDLSPEELRWLESHGVVKIEGVQVPR